MLSLWADTVSDIMLCAREWCKAIGRAEKSLLARYFCVSN